MVLFKNLINQKGKFGIWGIAFFICLGIALLVLPGLFQKNEEKIQTPTGTQTLSDRGLSSLNAIENDLAGQISKILSQVQGAGQVLVTVALEAGPEQSYARDASIVRSNVEEKDAGGGTRVTTETNEKSEVVFAQKQGEALVVKELGPQVKGVLVVSEGAKDPEIKARLSKAVQTMLNLPAHRVMVLPMEGR